jgi:hypothetical protein
MTTAYRLSVALALLMAAQSAGGLLIQTQYKDAAWIRAAWFANDWVTAAVAVPLLLIGLAGAGSGSRRGTLLWLGVVSYAVYNYAYYLFGAALNASFLLYVAGFLVAVIILILAVPRLGIVARARGLGRSTPARLAGAYLTLTGIGLAAAWISMWGAYVYAGRPTPIETEAFKLVAALDLSIMVPALTVGGIMLWRRHPWGYVIAVLAAIQASLYVLVLTGGSLVAVERGLVPAPGEIPVWTTLTLLTTTVAVLLLRNVRGEDGSANRGGGAGELH